MDNLIFALQNSSNNRGVIGIAMPTREVERWIRDATNLTENLENMGYQVDVQYAGDDVFVQLSQIEDMLTGGAIGLIIAPVNSSSLQYILIQAEEKGIPVIAYDRLLTGTPTVDYYTSFDNAMVGNLIGRYIEERLGLAEGNGPFNIELFSGSPTDNNAFVIAYAIYEVLEKYIENGQLQVPSGETSFAETWTLDWSKEAAKERMSQLLEDYYAERPLHAIVSPSDGISSGIIEALEEAGFVPGEEGWPIITGQDAEIEAVRNIIENKQSMSVFKDTRLLAERTAEVMDTILRGEVPESSEFSSTFNGFILVPTSLIEPEVVDINNYREVLIDSGYYTEEELFGE